MSGAVQSAIDTLAAAIEDLDAAAIGVDGLAASVKSGTLEEIAERRASVQKRIGDARRAADRLIEAVKSGRE